MRDSDGVCLVCDDPHDDLHDVDDGGVCQRMQVGDSITSRVYNLLLLITYMTIQ